MTIPSKHAVAHLGVTILRFWNRHLLRLLDFTPRVSDFIDGVPEPTRGLRVGEASRRDSIVSAEPKDNPTGAGRWLVVLLAATAN
jgi:hypothetical protein